jgi:hypothetical protein
VWHVSSRQHLVGSVVLLIPRSSELQLLVFPQQLKPLLTRLYSLLLLLLLLGFLYTVLGTHSFSLQLLVLRSKLCCLLLQHLLI